MNQGTRRATGRVGDGEIGNSRVAGETATALRLAAQGLNRAQHYFGELDRRWKARLGTPKAITAMAHT